CTSSACARRSRSTPPARSTWSRCAGWVTSSRNRELYDGPAHHLRAGPSPSDLDLARGHALRRRARGGVDGQQRVPGGAEGAGETGGLAGAAVVGEDLVAGLADELDQLGPVGFPDGVRVAVGARVAGAVPVEVLAAVAPA